MPITARYQSSWTERNIDALTCCFDNALANVLDSEFKRITKGKDPDVVANWLQQSKCNLGLLGNSGDSPDYNNPLVALRHLLQYQLSHINLSYTLVKSTQTNDWPANLGSVQVVDFGAGSLSMAFGLVLAVADALDASDQVHNVRIDCIDRSETMMYLGRKLGDRFYKQAKSRGLEPFTEAFNCVNVQRHINSHDVKQVRGHAECWLSALHVLYGENEDEIRAVMSALGNYGSFETFITCNYGKSDIAERVWPRNVAPRYKYIDPILRFKGDLENSHAVKAASSIGLCPSSWRIFGGFRQRDLVVFTTRRMPTIEDEHLDLPW